MFCKKCGKQIADDSKFCPECGASFESNNAASPANGAVPPANGAVPPANGAVPPANGPVYIVGTAPQPAKNHGCLKTFLIILAVIVIISFIGSKCSSSNDETTTEVVPTEMIKVSVNELEEALDKNIVAAKDKYHCKYVEIIGEIEDIDSGSIKLKSEKGITCQIKNSKTKEILKTLEKGQEIVVKGKIYLIGEILGYSLNVVEIIPQNQVASQESAQQNIENNSAQQNNENIEDNTAQLLEWITERFNMNELARDENFKKLKRKTVIFTGEVREVGKTFFGDNPYVSLKVDSKICIQFNTSKKSLISVIKDWKAGETHILKGRIIETGNAPDDVICDLTEIIE